MVFIFNDCIMFHSAVYFMLKSFKLLTNKFKKLCNECLGVVHTVCPGLKSTPFLIAVSLSCTYYLVECARFSIDGNRSRIFFLRHFPICFAVLAERRHFLPRLESGLMKTNLK